MLRCLGNFVAADEGYATTILQHGNLIAMLIALLNAPQPYVQPWEELFPGFRFVSKCNFPSSFSHSNLSEP